MTSRLGTSLVELLVVLMVVAVLLGLATLRVASVIDRVAVRTARQEVASAFANARDLAVARRARVSVSIDTGAATIRVRGQGVVLAERAVGVLYGVALTATRDSMSYDPRGLGYGAANLTLALQRGAAAETLLVSRLGRVRSP